MTIRTAALVAIVALAALALTALALPPRAGAGVYRAAQCHEPIGAGHADASFSRTSARYTGTAACRGDGLGIVHQPGDTPTRAGRHGSWAITAPPGTEIIRASARVSAAGQGWHVPQMLVALAGGARVAIDGVRGDLHGIGWAGAGGRSLIARLGCANRDECGPGRSAHLHLRRIVLALRDSIAPSVALDGTLVEPGSRRGPQTLEAVASDVGSGVRSVSVELNGDPLAVRTLECALAPDGVAIRLRPCPPEPRVGFDVGTASGQFRQGPNQLRVCAADHAAGSNINRGCASRTVRVDNLCPVSELGGARLAARFPGGSERTRIRSGESAEVTGTLRDQAGEPLAGAEVCVASRPLIAGREETVVAIPRTGPDGGFHVRLPAGPSREIRVAHWPDARRALERYLHLAVRARPRLRLRPRRTLHNGEHVRFTVRLPAPAANGRRLQVETRARGRWVRIAGGRTDGHGVWAGSYRFRSTTGRRTYAFRATVPTQRGYPYEAGRSRVARATVQG